MSIAPIRTRSGAAFAATAVIGSVLLPIAHQYRSSPRDSFPFSHYPMFSTRRGDRLRVSFLRGVRPDGTYVVLDSRLGARGGMNQERKQIASRARRRRRAESLAARVARRLHARDLHREVVAVEVVRAHFSIDGYFEPAPVEPIHAAVRGRAEVPGRRHSPEVTP